MKKVKVFEGKIVCRTPADGQSNVVHLNSFRYKVAPELGGQIGEVLMYKFNQLKFTTEEKTLLSRPIRELIYSYQNLSSEHFSNDVHALIEILNQFPGKKIEIQATDCGGLIALAAINSGKLKSDKKFILFLEETPLALFPKSFFQYHGKNRSHQIVFKLSEESWLRPFETLYQKPHYMHMEVTWDIADVVKTSKKAA